MIDVTLPLEDRPLSSGNHAARKGDHARAIEFYGYALLQQPELAEAVAGNIARSRKLYRRMRSDYGSLKVGICGWDLSHNAAGRVFSIAQMYKRFSEVEIIGCIDLQRGNAIWDPIKESIGTAQVIKIADWQCFIDKAMALTLQNPYDVVHLCKPRGPNLLVGLLYKLFWQAQVFVDVDDEELGFVGHQEPLELSDFLATNATLPPLRELTAALWTRLAVGLSGAFDGVTVSNPALQQRYGGSVVRHARDEEIFFPSEKLRSFNRIKHGIQESEYVVLFFGTPRAHKGLEQVADAIAQLGRSDIVFMIIGDFADIGLKAKLLAIEGVRYLFLGNQPFDSIPAVVSIADVCVFIQDEDSLAARFQVPAKLSDALAMNVPVIVNQTPALEDICRGGAVICLEGLPLAAILDRLLQNDTRLSMERNGRQFFEKHLSFASNYLVLDQLVRETRSSEMKCGSILVNALGDARLSALYRTVYRYA